MDLVELETASALLLLLFVVPLAVTMTVFLLWIMYGLTGKRYRHAKVVLRLKRLGLGTIAELAARKQKYKLGMFKKLYRILMAAVIALFVFFVVSSMSFSSRYEEGEWHQGLRDWQSRLTGLSYW